MQAFVNSITSSRKGESTIDLMRRRSTAPNGVMDFLLVKLLAHSRDQGFDRFSLGLAPMSGFQPKEDAIAGGASHPFLLQSPDVHLQLRRPAGVQGEICDATGSHATSSTATSSIYRASR